MKTQVAFLLGSLALVACNNGTTSDGEGGSTSTGTQSTGDGTQSTGDGNSTTGSGVGGEGGADPNSITLTMDEFDVPKGGEVYKCQNFANPFGGQLVEIGGFESHMSKGSHHMLLFYQANAVDGDLEDCSGLEFQATPYGTQITDDAVSFPAGVAAGLPGNYGFRVQSHYLNVTQETVHAKVQVTFHLVDSATVTAQAGVMFLVQSDIHVQPHSTQKVTYDCKLPQDMSIIKTWSHMHKHGTDFVSTIANKPFYNTTTWDEPKPTIFTPAAAFKSGDPLHFECTFQNDGDTELTFGESAQTNEMCILSSSFYPAPIGAPTISCDTN